MKNYSDSLAQFRFINKSSQNLNKKQESDKQSRKHVCIILQQCCNNSSDVRFCSNNELSHYTHTLNAFNAQTNQNNSQMGKFSEGLRITGDIIMGLNSIEPIPSFSILSYFTYPGDAKRILKAETKSPKPSN